DAFGNTVTGDGSTVIISSGNTSIDGTSTLSVAASSGVTTFNNIKPTTAGGSKTLSAADGSLTVATSNGFTVNVAAAAKLAFGTRSEARRVGEEMRSWGWGVLQEDMGNTVTGGGSTVTMSTG